VAFIISAGNHHIDSSAEDSYFPALVLAMDVLEDIHSGHDIIPELGGHLGMETGNKISLASVPGFGPSVGRVWAKARFSGGWGEAQLPPFRRKIEEWYNMQAPADLLATWWSHMQTERQRESPESKGRGCEESERDAAQLTGPGSNLL
jgi:hypothetical protein